MDDFFVFHKAVPFSDVAVNKLYSRKYKSSVRSMTFVYCQYSETNMMHVLIKLIKN